MREQNLAEGVADRTLERVAHTVAHVRGDDSHCPRELVSDGARGVEGQVLHLLSDVLTHEEIAEIRDVLGMGEDGQPYLLEDYIDSDEEALWRGQAAARALRAAFGNLTTVAREFNAVASRVMKSLTEAMTGKPS